MKRFVASFGTQMKGRPFLFAMILALLFLVVHGLNLALYGALRVASSYLLGYVVFRDLLLGIIDSETIVNTVLAATVFLGFYGTVRLMGSRPTNLVTVITLLFLVLALASIPLFPERAFYRP